MTHWQNMWKFKTPHFTVQWDIAPEDDVDISWDDTGEVREKLESGVYECFCSRVVVYADGHEVGCDYLGNSIYENPKDFRDHIGARGKYGSYFTDMVACAIDEARKNVAAFKEIRVRAA